MQFGLFTRVAPFGVEQAARDVEQEGRAAEIASVDEVQINALADNALVAGDRWPDQLGSQFQHRVCIEHRGQPFRGQLDTVALHAGEADFQVIALGAHGFDLNSLAGRL